MEISLLAFTEYGSGTKRLMEVVSKVLEQIADNLLPILAFAEVHLCQSTVNNAKKNAICCVLNLYAQTLPRKCQLCL